jgi:hypothetical protein
MLFTTMYTQRTSTRWQRRRKNVTFTEGRRALGAKGRLEQRAGGVGSEQKDIGIGSFTGSACAGRRDPAGAPSQRAGGRSDRWGPTAPPKGWQELGAEGRQHPLSADGGQQLGVDGGRCLLPEGRRKLEADCRREEQGVYNEEYTTNRASADTKVKLRSPGIRLGQHWRWIWPPERWSARGGGWCSQTLGGHVCFSWIGEKG